jgi:ABC-2 type transport system permease protein
MVSMQKKNRNNSLFKLFGWILFLMLIIFLSNQYFKRFDLTDDKRYSLSDSTKKLLAHLPGQIQITVYLKGDMPAGFERLSKSTKELLDEFKVYSGDKLQYIFVDPAAGKSDSDKTNFYQQLSKEGLQPTNVQVNGSDQYSSKIVVPGAMIYYGKEQAPVNLLVNEMGLEAQDALNVSVSQLENQFSQAIQILTQIQKTKIAFATGEGELSPRDVSDILQSLSQFYEIHAIDLNRSLIIPQEISCVIIAKPTLAFSETDKFKLDQYLMRGGRILWLLNGTSASIDSLRIKPKCLAIAQALNLDDQLFRYGVRMNPNLIMDLQCNPVPLVVNYTNGQPDFRPFPCMYFPVFASDENHLILKNVDAVEGKFASSLDTLANPEVKKTILLHSSLYTKIAPIPWMIDLSDLRNKPDENEYTRKNIPVAVLLEGKFTSDFKNQVAPTLDSTNDSLSNYKFIDASKPTSQIVIADGDMIQNDVSPQGQPMTLGFYNYTGQLFANKNFILNCIDYLTGQTSHIEMRAKTVKLRLLDVNRVKAEKTKWQLINLIIPIALLVVFGFIYTLIRQWRYSRKRNTQTKNT